MTNWKRTRAIWTILMMLLPWAIASFAMWDANVAHWEIATRAITAYASSVFGILAFMFPGYRW